MHLMKKLFSITTPLSTYLQAPDMEFIQAMKLVMTTKQQLQNMRVDKIYGNIFNDSTLFCIEHDLDEKGIQEKRISLKKK